MEELYGSPVRFFYGKDKPPAKSAEKGLFLDIEGNRLFYSDGRDADGNETSVTLLNNNNMLPGDKENSTRSLKCSVSAEDQVAIGRYNETDTEGTAIFMVGTGEQVSNPFTALKVSATGITTLYVDNEKLGAAMDELGLTEEYGGEQQ